LPAPGPLAEGPTLDPRPARIAGVNVGVVLVMNLVTLAATSKAAEDRLGSEFSQSMRPRADSLARVMR